MARPGLIGAAHLVTSEAQEAGQRAERIVCTACGFVEQAASGRCASCDDETYDLNVDADETFVREYWQIRQTRRWGLAVLLGIAICLGLHLLVAFSAGWWGPMFFDLDAWDVEQLKTSFIAGVDIVIYVGLFLFSPPVYWLLKRRQPEARRRAEAYVFRQQRSDTLRALLASPILLAIAILAVNLVAVLSGWSDLTKLDPIAAMFSAPDASRPAALFGMIPADVLHGERLWTLGTYVFVHGDVEHLWGNLAGLLLLGPAVDLRLGKLRATVLICATAIIGALTHAVITSDPAITIIGASAIVYGLAGANLVLFPQRPMVLGSPEGMMMKVPTWVWVALVVGASTAFHIFSDAPIAWLAHLGGFLAGAAVAFPFRSAPIPPAFERLEVLRERRLQEID